MRHESCLKAITPVILCGGAGRRLRPLSTEKTPKPFLRLGGARSLLQETLARVTECAAPVLVLNRAHRGLALRDLAGAGCRPDLIILEPVARNTAPALAAVSLAAQAEVILVLPSDHDIRNPDVLMEVVERCLPMVQAGAMVSFGITPTRAETGYGYIRLGAGREQGVFRVEAFMEKPDRATARSLLRQGDCVWNSGIFLVRRDVLAAALQTYQPEIMAAVTAAAGRGWRDGVWFMLDDSFAHAPALSIDVAVMERAANLLCCPVPLCWNDVGTWMGLLRRVA